MNSVLQIHQQSIIIMHSCFDVKKEEKDYACAITAFALWSWSTPTNCTFHNEDSLKVHLGHTFLSSGLQTHWYEFSQN